MEKAKRIIEKIKDENIKPIPKWYFSSKNILIWLAFIISIFIGAAAFSIILFSIQQTDFNLISHLSHSRLELFLGLLPFFWMIALLIFLIMAIFSIQNSKKGYKFTWSRLVGFSTAISILLGTLCFIGGGGQWLENTFAAKVGVYESIEEKKKKIWMNPEEGYLSGVIEKVSGDSFLLIDFNNKKWGIAYDDAFIPPAVFLENGEQVKLIGKPSGTNSFQADEIRPWGGQKNRKERMKKVREGLKNSSQK